MPNTNVPLSTELTPETEREIRFTAYGRAQTAGSKSPMPIRKNRQIIGLRVAEGKSRKAQEHAKCWRTVVQDAAREVFGGPQLTGALAVRFVFYSPRPKGHYGTGRNAGVLKASAPRFPTKRPDVLKLARAAEDALTGIVWRDDAQIVREVLLKHYGEPARCEVKIEVLYPEFPQ